MIRIPSSLLVFYAATYSYVISAAAGDLLAADALASSSLATRDDRNAREK